MPSPTHSQTLPGEPAPTDPTGQPEVVSQGADATMREMMVDELAFDTDMVIDDDQIGVPPSQAGSLAAHPPEINAADVADARRARDREHQRLARARESEDERALRLRRNRERMTLARDTQRGEVGLAGPSGAADVDNSEVGPVGGTSQPPVVDAAAARRARDRERHRLARARETEEQRALRLQRDRERRRLKRAAVRPGGDNTTEQGRPGDDVPDAPPLPAVDPPPPDVGLANAEMAPEVQDVPLLLDVGNVGEVVAAAPHTPDGMVPGAPLPPVEGHAGEAGDAVAPELPDMRFPPAAGNLGAAVDAPAPRPAVVEVQGRPLPLDVGRAGEPDDAPNVDAVLPPDAENVHVAMDAPAPRPPIAEAQDIPIPPAGNLGAAVDAPAPRPAVVEVQGLPLSPDVVRAGEPEDAPDVDALLPPDAENVDMVVDAAAPIAEIQGIPNPPDVGRAGEPEGAAAPNVNVLLQPDGGANEAGNAAVPDPVAAEAPEVEPDGNADQVVVDPGVIRRDPRGGRRRDQHRLARNYEAANFEPLAGMQLGRMDTVCEYCGALRWPKEAKGACCHQGKVQLDFHPPPPDELVELMTPGTEYYQEFRDKIRAYNTAFQLASIGCNVVRLRGRNPTFTVQGNVCHLIGSLLPLRDGNERFMQLYFLDADQANERRANLCGGLERDVLNSLLDMLHEHNNYVRALQPALAMARGVPNCQIVLSAENRPRSEHERRFNVPIGREVAVLVPNEIRGRRDIVVHERGGPLFRINEFSRQYDPMLYVLLHPRGTDGWSIELKNARGVTMRQYAAFHMRYRPGHFNLIPRGGRLYQQYLVDTQVKVETDRLCYVRDHQDGFNGFRAETIRGVRDALADGEEQGRAVGRRVVLPASVTGSPRYMMSKLQDALCYVREYGAADFFITVTCNTAWPEIVDTLRALYPGAGEGEHDKAVDHPDIVSQVFDLKLQALLSQLRAGILGRQRAVLHTIEWQKRGLPHAHILLWVTPPDKPRAGEEVDACVCAEVPDPEIDPNLHAIVCAKMVHGPCGALNPQSSCMKDGRCSAGYPKPYQEATALPERGYPQYRRRSPEDGGRRAQAPGRLGVEIDSRWIVPYNPYILRSFDAHVNVEVITHAVHAIRYCIKYVTKGSDQIMFAVQPDGVIDEVAQYQHSRYLGAMEAAWRLLDRPIHVHYPPVQQLHLHLDGDERRVVFRDDANLDAVLRGEQDNPSMLSGFFELCQRDEFAATLLYTEVPRYYTWQVRRGRGEEAQRAHWRRRLRGQPHEEVPGVFASDTLSRVFTTTPRAGDVYFLRLLLHHVRGPRSFEHLRTVDGRVCATMREACSELRLLEDGEHWAHTMQEATVSRFPRSLRFLFALILIEGEATCDPMALWMAFRDAMSEDITRRQIAVRAAGGPGLTEDQVREVALRKIASILFRLHGRSLAEYGLPEPRALDAADDDEPDGPEFDPVAQAERVDRDEPRLTDDQRFVYDEVMRRLNNGESGVIFLQAPGGCGKTYLENLLLAKVRGEGHVAVAVAASGIAAGLLEGGTTAHHRFKIPLQLHDDDDNVCGILRRSPEADYLRRCRLIVWDEAAMTSRRATEAVDRALQDIRGNQQLFGGILTLMSGDWRQILPVVRRGARAQVVDACLKSSPLWPRVDTMELATNMRARNGDDQAGAFADFLLRVGDGRLPVVAEPDTIEMPEQLRSPAGNLDEFVDRIFPELADRYRDEAWLHERAILSPFNASVDRVNEMVLARLPGEVVTYESVDSINDDDNPEHGPPIPVEVLNAIDVSGMPSHRIHVKVGAPVVLMRNLDAPRVVNGTVCTVVRAAPNVLELRIANGAARGEILFLPRLPLVVSAVDSGLGRSFRRLQFPVKLAFSMTINRCQGQTKRRVGIYLPVPVFTHGQLYVALSRVGSFEAVEVLSSHNHRTRNVVYREVL